MQRFLQAVRVMIRVTWEMNTMITRISRDRGNQALSQPRLTPICDVSCLSGRYLVDSYGTTGKFSALHRRAVQRRSPLECPFLRLFCLTPLSKTHDGHHRRAQGCSSAVAHQLDTTRSVWQECIP